MGSQSASILRLSGSAVRVERFAAGQQVGPPAQIVGLFARSRHRLQLSGWIAAPRAPRRSAAFVQQFTAKQRRAEGGVRQAGS